MFGACWFKLNIYRLPWLLPWILNGTRRWDEGILPFIFIRSSHQCIIEHWEEDCCYIADYLNSSSVDPLIYPGGDNTWFTRGFWFLNGREAQSFMTIFKPYSVPNSKTWNFCMTLYFCQKMLDFSSESNRLQHCSPVWSYRASQFHKRKKPYTFNRLIKTLFIVLS